MFDFVSISDKHSLWLFTRVTGRNETINQGKTNVTKQHHKTVRKVRLQIADV